MIKDRITFDRSIIAQDGSGEYQYWVAVVSDNWAALAKYYPYETGYDAWESISEKGWAWQGTPKQLAEMARTKADPAGPLMPGGGGLYEINSEDREHYALLDVYMQVIDWVDGVKRARRRVVKIEQELPDRFDFI